MEIFDKKSRSRSLVKYIKCKKKKHKRDFDKDFYKVRKKDLSFKMLSSTIRYKSILNFTSFFKIIIPELCEDVMVNKESILLNHPYEEHKEDIPISNPLISEIKKNDQDPQIFLKNKYLSVAFDPKQISLGHKEKLFPISSGRSHNPNNESLTLQKCLVERLKILQLISSCSHDKTLLDSLKIIDQKISEWHTKIVQQPTKSLKIENLAPYIPDLPTDYLMQKHAYEPNPFAKKLMIKMGWKAGYRLGKEEKTIDETDELKLEIKFDKSGLKTFVETINDIDLKKILVKHPVSALNEICQKLKWSEPVFEEAAPCKNILKVKVKGRTFEPTNPSINKKEARALAAREALIGLGLLPDPELEALERQAVEKGKNDFENQMAQFQSMMSLMNSNFSAQTNPSTSFAPSNNTFNPYLIHPSNNYTPWPQYYNNAYLTGELKTSYFPNQPYNNNYNNYSPTIRQTMQLPPIQSSTHINGYNPQDFISYDNSSYNLLPPLPPLLSSNIQNKLPP